VSDIMPVLGGPGTAGVTFLFVSCALLLTARGLRRGLRAAWLSTIGLILISIGIRLVHDSNDVAVIAPALVTAWLASRADCFPVTQAASAVRRSIVIGVGGTLSALGIAVALAVTFDQADVDDAIAAAAPRLGGVNSLPLDYGGQLASLALAFVGLCLLIGTLWPLLSPLRSAPTNTDSRRSSRERASHIINRYGGDTLAYFALRDDKTWFFTRKSLVAYAVKRGVCVVSPDPVGPISERALVWGDFIRFAEENGWSVTILGASAEWLPIYEASGLRPVYLGDEAIIPCQTFSLEGRAMRSVRQAHSRVRRANYSVELYDPATIDEGLRTELIALATLCRHGKFERGFSMTLSRLFELDDLGLMLSVAYDANGVPQAFIQWVPCAGGWSLDVMRRNTSAEITNGLIEFLIIESVQNFASQGLTRVGLNFSVFRNIISGETEHWTARVAQKLLHASASQTQIESLWRFNAKFSPVWEPRYAVLGTFDSFAAQSVVMAGAEGITELPLVGRFMTGMARC